MNDATLANAPSYATTVRSIWRLWAAMWVMTAAFMLVVAAGSLTDVPRLIHGATASQGTREG